MHSREFRTARLAVLFFSLWHFGAMGHSLAQDGANRSNGPGQQADGRFQAFVKQPNFPLGSGPTVGIDEAHCNFHTLHGRYEPFAKVLAADGYNLQSVKQVFTPEVLAPLDVLVVANALAPKNERDWSLPTPSAFSENEIDAVKEWVDAGGALMLIADHMPFPGAAHDLAAKFDLQLYNGFVFDKVEKSPMRFGETGHKLCEHDIVKGPGKPVRWVQTFTGSCFTDGKAFSPLFVLGAGAYSLEPAVAWQFSAETPRREVKGFWQAAVRECGVGRMAMFGEAAMFTAQQNGGARSFGLNHPDAEYNQRFLRNTMYWLSNRASTN